MLKQFRCHRGHLQNRDRLAENASFQNRPMIAAPNDPNLYPHPLSEFTMTAIILATALFAVAADTKADDLKAIQGTWNVVGGFVNGKAMPAEEIKGSPAYIFTEKTYSVSAEGKKGETVAFTLDPTSSPKKITSKISDPDGKTFEFDLIYEIEGDNLKLAMRLTGETPKSFDSKAGDKTTIIILKRKK